MFLTDMMTALECWANSRTYECGTGSHGYAICRYCLARHALKEITLIARQAVEDGEDMEYREMTHAKVTS